jgi:hypothetical protein
VLAFAAAGALTTALALLVLDRGDQPYKQITLSQLRVLENVLARAAPASSGTDRIVFLGDSLSVGPLGFLNSKGWVSTHLGGLVNAGIEHPRRVSMVPIIGSGLSVYSYYFMSDRIIEFVPDAVVVQFNLFWLSEHWHRSLDRTVMAAWLPLSWWREAVALPLHLTTLTTDRWILYRSLQELGLFDLWYQVQREQARLPDAYWNLATWIQESARSPAGLDFRKDHKWRIAVRHRDKRNRATPLAARQQFEPALNGIEGDHFALRVLDALLGRLENAGIPVLVYLPPHNVEHLETLGLMNREGLDTTVARIEAVVRRRGASFVDLHDQLPDAAFRDYLDHYVDDSELEGSRLIAEQLAPQVLDTLIRRAAGP